MKLIIILFFSLCYASSVFAENLWLGLRLPNGVIIPFAHYQGGDWREIWNPPRVWANDSYYHEHHLPLPEMDRNTEMLAVEKTASLENLPADWIEGQKIPLRWYDILSGKEYLVNKLMQYDMNCDVSWGLSSHGLSKGKDASSRLTSAYVTSKPMYSSPFHKLDMDSQAEKNIRTKLLTQAVNIENKNLSIYKSPEQCTKLHNQKHIEYAKLGNNYVWPAKYEKSLASACQELRERKVRVPSSLDHVQIEQARLSDDIYLYHATASMYFPSINVALSIVRLDSWFLGENNNIYDIQGCGESLNCTCAKGSYRSFPKVVFEFQGHQFVLDEQSCYFGGNKIYELIDGKMEDIFSKSWGGC